MGCFTGIDFMGLCKIDRNTMHGDSAEYLRDDCRRSLISPSLSCSIIESALGTQILPDSHNISKEFSNKSPEPDTNA